MAKTLLLCFIHGFKGDDDTFGKKQAFTHHLRQLVANALPKIRVEVLIYPKYETQGDLRACVRKFTEWLQEKVVDLEVAAGTPSPTVDQSVRTILIGHSMGGIVAAETVIGLASDPAIHQGDNTQPLPNIITTSPPSSPAAASRYPSGSSSTSAAGAMALSPPIRNSLMFPYIQGVLAFDTPYLGIAPGVVARGAEGHYTAASSAIAQISELAAEFMGGGAAATASAATAAAEAYRPPSGSNAQPQPLPLVRGLPARVAAPSSSLSKAGLRSTPQSPPSSGPRDPRTRSRLPLPPPQQQQRRPPQQRQPSHDQTRQQQRPQQPRSGPPPLPSLPPQQQQRPQQQHLHHNQQGPSQTSPNPSSTSTPSSNANTAASASTWSWGRIAMLAGGGAVAVASGAVAYMKRDQLSSGWTWATSHLEFVGCLACKEELRRRVGLLLRLERDLGVGFTNLYTRLGRGATVSGPGMQIIGTMLLGNERTFCNVPKREHAGTWVEATNDKASDEIGAHTTMFEPSKNPGYEKLARDASGHIASWVIHTPWYAAVGNAYAAPGV